MRKILYSPGFGGGWSSWNRGPVAQLMLEYTPIIEAIERGEEMHKNHPAIQQLEKEAKEKFGEEYVCTLGADRLRVARVSGRIRIKEYDGYESFEEEGDLQGWM